jgi:hypothetical protein
VKRRLKVERGKSDLKYKFANKADHNDPSVIQNDADDAALLEDING